MRPGVDWQKCFTAAALGAVFAGLWVWCLYDGPGRNADYGYAVAAPRGEEWGDESCYVFAAGLPLP